MVYDLCSQRVNTIKSYHNFDKYKGEAPNFKTIDSEDDSENMYRESI